MLVGGKLVALVDDQIPVGAKLAAALETRKRAIPVKGLLMLATALESAFGGAHPSASEDGADHVADIVAAVAADKRGVIDERRIAAQAATRDRVRAASAAAQAAAAQTAMPGDLEDLGGGSSSAPDTGELPDKAELERLRSEVARRVAEMSKSMTAARDAATDLADKAKGAAARGAADEAAQLERRADAERVRMHSMLAELAQLESELKELERAIAQVGDLPPKSEAPPKPPRVSIDDELEKLKRGAPAKPAPKSGPTKVRQEPKTVDDELAQLKKKMQQGPAPKKK
jgi:hypothetical protein